MATIVKIFTGEYDLKHQAALHAEFDALHVEDSLVLDMSAVTYLDSTFIDELIWLHELRAQQGCDRLTIVRPASIVKKVLALLYVFTFARVVATIDEALAPNGARVVIHRACRGDNPTTQWPVPVLKSDVPTPAWISSVLTAAGL
jgi:anti-anti-sigma regulatory factor